MAGAMNKKKKNCPKGLKNINRKLKKKKNTEYIQNTCIVHSIAYYNRTKINL